MPPVADDDRKLKLLFVDDSLPLCMLYTRMAQGVDGVVSHAMQSPLQALDWAREHQPEMVVVDYLMPEMDGLKFLEALTGVTSSWAVRPSLMMITAVDEMDVRLAALKLGVLDFLAKPLQDIEFVTRLRNVAAAHRNLLYLKERDQEFSELQVVQENAMEGIARLDAEDRHTWANPVYARLVGLARQDLIGSAWFDVVQGEDLAEYRAAYQWMRQSGQSWTHVRLRRPDGSLAVAEISLVALPRRNGEYTGHMRFARDVTEQHQAAERMRESQERLRHALEATQDGLWDWNLLSGEVYYSARWMTMLGHPADTLPGTAQTWEELCHPDDWPSVQRHIADHLAGTTPQYQFEHRLRHRNGHWVWVLGRGRVVERAADHTPLRLVGTNIDITKRREQDLLLKQSEERWQFAIDGSGDGIWDWDIAHHSVFFSPRWKSMLGYEADEISDHFDEWRRLMYPGDLPESVRRLEDYLSGHTTEYENQFRMRTRQGNYRWILSRGMVTSRDENGQPLRMIGTHHDIHERHLAEQAIQDSEARFRDMAENFPGVVIQIRRVADGDSMRFVMAYVSPRMQALFDLSAEQVLAQLECFTERIHPEDLPLFNESLIESFNEGKPWSFQGRYLHPEGRQLWFESVARPSASIDFQAFNGVLLDITSRKQLERVKDEFVSTVSHELRTPLTSILGSLKLVSTLAGAALPGKVGDLLALALRNAERLLSLINDLLDMAKIESGALSITLVDFPAANLLNEAIAANQGYAAKMGVTLQGNATSPSPSVVADFTRAMQVLSNLISNACKFSPQGSTVTVQLATEAHHLLFSVIDHGPGISPEFHDKIFSKFSQADSSDARKIGGTGLGLSICKALVERMGGQIGFHSTPHVRTAFWFTLPLATD